MAFSRLLGIQSGDMVTDQYSCGLSPLRDPVTVTAFRSGDTPLQERVVTVSPLYLRGKQDKGAFHG